ncbi:hypothetical protein [Marinilabilia rubra]|uniref:Uncharacterized protein n=1 Tax=Marinilabilia rubra TaxID=2162893 RepID=A0A2U2B985_9BACT|nr:hypothetical protein [Marinilabilia rubra]PWD99604.1 hypothetical protein DDZ16_09155 [Marinilabilia rubra]
MKKIHFLIFLSFLAFNAKSQFSVTLKVIDNHNGELTNNVDDFNGTNVYCWAGNDSITLYDDSDYWWHPMYGNSERPGGELIKNNGTWIWQCTFDNVPPGDYRWNPYMKNLGWKPINTFYNYAQEPDIHFSIGSDGKITGQTTLELPLVSTSLLRQF